MFERISNNFHTEVRGKDTMFRAIIKAIIRAGHDRDTLFSTGHGRGFPGAVDPALSRIRSLKAPVDRRSLAPQEPSPDGVSGSKDCYM